MGAAGRFKLPPASYAHAPVRSQSDLGPHRRRTRLRTRHRRVLGFAEGVLRATRRIASFAGAIRGLYKVASKTSVTARALVPLSSSHAAERLTAIPLAACGEG